MSRQIPRGDDDLNCPFWQKPMSEVCHKCPLWTQIRGKNPQSTQEIDEWNCAIAFLPMILIENNQRQIHTAASVDKVASEVQSASTKAHETNAMFTQLLNRAMDVQRDVRIGIESAFERKLIGSG